MNLLLDTHIAIWALNDDLALSEKARELILSSGNVIYYSAVSVWEVLLKHSRRPESIPIDEKDFIEGCLEAGFVSLPAADKLCARCLDQLAHRSTMTRSIGCCWRWLRRKACCS